MSWWRELWLDFLVEGDARGWMPYLWTIALESLALGAVCAAIFAIGCAEAALIAGLDP